MKIYNEIKKYEYTNDNNPDASFIRNYLEWILNLPWNKYSEEITDVKKIKKSLDKSHFGLDEAKNRILEYIAIKKNSKNVNAPINLINYFFYEYDESNNENNKEINKANLSNLDNKVKIDHMVTKTMKDKIKTYKKEELNNYHTKMNYLKNMLNK